MTEVAQIQRRWSSALGCPKALAHVLRTGEGVVCAAGTVLDNVDEFEAAREDEALPCSAVPFSTVPFKYAAICASGRNEGAGKLAAGVVIGVGAPPSWFTFWPTGGAFGESS
jgi:phage tail tape-measure protein